MSKFYEDVSEGKVNMEDINKYFNKTELNYELRSIGKIHAINYSEEDKAFNINYVNENEVSYVGQIKLSGEVTELQRTDLVVTDVWVTFYDETKTLTYSTSKDVVLEDQTITYQWDITEGTVKSYKDLVSGNIDLEDPLSILVYQISPSILKVKVLEEIIPKRSECLFANLSNCTSFEGLEKINYSYCKEMGRGEFFNCTKLTSINIPSTVEKIASDTFQLCLGLQTINIDKPSGSITGAPWTMNTSNPTINWKN